MKSDNLTVLVFKENLASRAFKVPLSWITKLGFVLGICALLTVFMALLTAKYYRSSRLGSPVRVQELENSLAEARATNDSLETKVKELTASRITTAPPVAITPAPETSQAVASAPLPIPTVTVTMTATPTTAAPAGTQNFSKPLLFSALPASSNSLPPAASTLSFKLDAPRAFWQGNTLIVRSNLRYTREDNGSQQGRIVILARGAETILAYPDGVLNPMGAESLLEPKEGEYFSVSRFREVKAEFGPFKNRNSVKEAQVLIFNTTGQVLLEEKLIPQKPAAPAAPAPSTRTEPNKTEDAPITPGTDE